jgi:hypothetical protein
VYVVLLFVNFVSEVIDICSDSALENTIKPDSI